MKGNLLIVDDQPDIRKLIRMTLEFEGYTLIEAQDGAEALRLAKSSSPEFVLLDVMMPGEFDGFQVCERLKSDPSMADTMVVMLTARGQQADLERGRRSGANAYLTKPFSPLELIDTIERLASARTKA